MSVIAPITDTAAPKRPTPTTYERQPRHSTPPDDRDVWMARLDPTGETACRDVMRDQRQQNNKQHSGSRRGASHLRGHNS